MLWLAEAEQTCGRGPLCEALDLYVKGLTQGLDKEQALQQAAETCLHPHVYGHLSVLVYVYAWWLILVCLCAYVSCTDWHICM